MKIHEFLENPPEDGLPRITAEQEAIIERMANEPTRAILNASTVGAGKTLLTAELMIRRGITRALIIGIKDTFSQWEKCLSDQTDGEVKLRRIDSTKAGKANLAAMIAGEQGIFFGGSQFLVRQDWDYRPVVDLNGDPVMKLDKDMNVTDKQETERVQTHIYRKMPDLEMLVVDEVHIVAANRKNIARRTLMSMTSIWKVALSGTPYGNKFENMWSITRWLWGSFIDGSFHRWKDEWCAVETEEIYVGGKSKEVEKIMGEKNEGAFVQTLPCYVRIEAEEPAPPAELVYVDLTAAQRAQYAQMEKDMLAWLREHGHVGTDAELAPLVAEVEISKRQRLRTATLGEMSFNGGGEVDFEIGCKSSKLTALAGILKVWGDQKAVIYTDSKKFAKITAERMARAGYSVAAWHGDVPSKKRDEIKAAFLRPNWNPESVQYIVAVISAFGTGLDGFQGVCSKICWLSETENGIQNEQAVGRIWRRGVDRDAFQHVKILARDTYDEGIFAGLRQREESRGATLRTAA